MLIIGHIVIYKNYILNWRTHLKIQEAKHSYPWALSLNTSMLCTYLVFYNTLLRCPKTSTQKRLNAMFGEGIGGGGGGGACMKLNSSSPSIDSYIFSSQSPYTFFCN